MICVFYPCIYPLNMLILLKMEIYNRPYVFSGSEGSVTRPSGEATNQQSVGSIWRPVIETDSPGLLDTFILW